MLRRHQILTAFAVGALVVGCAVAAAAGGTTLTRVSRQTPFRASCNGTPQTVSAYVNAEIEPYVAANPRNPANAITVYQQDRYSNGGANGVLTAVTFDTGRTWRVLPLAEQPEFSRCTGGNRRNGGDFDRASDPWVAFGPDGTAYQVAVSFDESDSATAELASTSRDGGRTWSPLASLIRDNHTGVEDERPAVSADPTRPGYAYVVWDRDVFAPARQRRGPTMFTRTTDAGATWSPARAIYMPALGRQTSGNEIAVLPNGDLVDVFENLTLGAQGTHPRHHRIMAIRSTNAGRTWSAPITISSPYVTGTTDPRTGEVIRNGDIFPHIAADPRPGRRLVYVVWEDARLDVARRHQIALSRSADGGRTWSAPQRVSSNPHTQALVPNVAVNTRGVVAVTYYDLSADTAASPALATQYWITFSSDSARTWSRREQVTAGPFDYRTAPFAGGFFLGEYQGLRAAESEFYVAATFTNGRSLTNRTDIYSATYRRR